MVWGATGGKKPVSSGVLPTSVTTSTFGALCTRKSRTSESARRSVPSCTFRFVPRKLRPRLRKAGCREKAARWLLSSEVPDRSRYSNCPLKTHLAFVIILLRPDLVNGLGKVVSPWRFNSLIPSVTAPPSMRSDVIDSEVSRLQRESEREYRRIVGEAARACSNVGVHRVEARSRCVSDGNEHTKAERIDGGTDVTPRRQRRLRAGNTRPGTSIMEDSSTCSITGETGESADWDTGA